MGVSKPHVEEINFRRNAIRKLVLEEGITNREEIRRRLKKDHNLDVARQTVYQDFDSIAGDIPEEKIKEFHLDLIAIYKTIIREYQKRIDKCDDNDEWIKLTRAQSQMMKDMGVVAGNLAFIESGRNRDRRKKEVDEDESVISFDEPIVSDDVEDEEVEDADSV